MIRKLYFVSLILFGFSIVSAQKNGSLLGKAFNSKDSSNYYFKLAKNAATSESDLAEYYFCKNARCTDYNQPDSAVIYGKIALEKFKKIGKTGAAFSVFNNISKVYQSQGQYGKAVQMALEGLQMAEKEKNEYWEIMFTISLSNKYHDFENYAKGTFYGKKGYELAKNAKKPNNDFISYALNTLAINFDDWNFPEKALLYHKKNFEYQKGKDTLKLGTTYNNIGNTLLKMKKFQEASRWFNRCLKIYEVTLLKKDDAYYYNFATVYTNLAQIATDLNNFEKAEKLFVKAKYFCIKSTNAEKLRDYYYQNAKFNKKRKDLQKTIDSQESYIKLRDSIFNKDRDRSLADLEAKYQNEKKEREIVANKSKILESEFLLKQKNNQFLLVGLLLIGFLVVGFLMYRQQKLKNTQQAQTFELKQAISQIETQNKLQNQRLAISKDLHDNIGAQLTFIISSVETAKFAPEIANTKLGNKLTKISDFTKDTIIELRDTIWAMNSSEISFEDLQIRISNFIEKANDVSENSIFKFTIDANLNNIKLSSITGMNIYRTIQEAVNNALKHASAPEIVVAISAINDKINILITDNGFGFNKDAVMQGNGLQNMQKRIEEIGGTFNIKSEPGKGTKISILI